MDVLIEPQQRIQEAYESRTTKLDLSNLNLTALPEAIGQLTQLQELDIGDNQLTALPEAIGQLTRLQELRVSGNQLTALPEAIGQLTQLQELRVSGNQLTALPEAISQLTQLQRLDVGDNQLTALPEAIGQLTQLQELRVSDNQLTALPETIGQLTQLQKLRVGGNRLTTLPEAIGQLTQLRELRVGGNQLTALPKTIGQCNKIQYFDISNNDLSSLPDAIFQLKDMQDLYLGYNNLCVLPETIGQFSHLQYLDISGNELSKLPKTIGQCTQLECLQVNGNGLHELPETINRLTQLRILDAASNHIQALPQRIDSLNRLNHLDLSHNNIKNIMEVCQLTSLEELYLLDNHVTKVPEAIGQITHLQKLSFACNRLKNLPDSLEKMTHLRELYVDNNKLIELPRSLYHLSELEQISLHENESLRLSPAILGSISENVLEPNAPVKRAQKILEYCFGESRPLNEAKLILVGFGNVGKTLLVNRLVYNTFNRDEQETTGIQITQWPITLHTQEKVNLRIWDFGGQEIMHATHQFFLTQRSLYLLVLNGRKGHEDDDANYWLSLINSFAEDSPVIVVLNKIREHPFTISITSLQRKFPNLHHVIETDCADGIGITELQKAILHETDRLEHLRDKFPAAWFAIKDWLSGMKQNYLTFEEYRSHCRQKGVGDEQDQNELAVYLHNLGIALNYKDDARLRDMHVLNPRWVTNGIYTILNAKKLEEQKGELQLNDLTDILDPADYPPERYTFLLELMRKFELCFKFSEEDDRYLIPQLLDKEVQPLEIESFKPQNCLQFQYQYPVLPEGLLPRFIVRTHVLSTGQPRWRSGVILDFEGSNALVRAETLDKQVDITVAGPVSSRRRLLAVIRSDFDHIHDSYKFQPQEMVPDPDHPGVVLPYQKLLVMERKGEPIWKEVIGDDVVELDVKRLLDGVDLEGARTIAPSKELPGRVPRPLLFYSYSHKDDELCQELVTHLKILEHQKFIDSWYDRRIIPGDEWKGQIDNNLERADIILLLVSCDFLASNYCYDIEMKRALERNEAGDARVIPVIVRDVSWEAAPFGKLQALPKGGKPVTQPGDRTSMPETPPGAMWLKASKAL